MIPRRSSGSSRADIGVEPTRSQNITVSCRRSASAAVPRTGTATAAPKSPPRSTAGVEQPTAVADRGYPDVLEVLVRQRREDRSVDVFFAENRLVFRPGRQQNVTSDGAG